MTLKETLDLVGKNEEDVKEAARKVCGCGECICGYEGCTHSNRRSMMPNIGKDEHCPLEKYEIEPQEKKKGLEDNLPSFAKPMDSPDLMDLFLLCADCEHCDISLQKDTLDIERTDESYREHCLDCPVQMIMESIQENEAEAKMS